jgi:hypothetical protein
VGKRVAEEQEKHLSPAAPFSNDELLIPFNFTTTMSGGRKAMLKKALVGMFALALCAGVAQAVEVTYEAEIGITWNNGYLGTRTSVDPSATVVVDYDGAGGFTITSVDYQVTEGDIGTTILDAAGDTSGTISGGIATGTMGYAGTAGNGAYTVSNTGGPYSGTASAGGMFGIGDVYQLTDNNFGTLSPAIGGVYGNWDNLIDAPGTYINFLTPEPATGLLLLAGLPLLRRRR